MVIIVLKKYINKKQKENNRLFVLECLIIFLFVILIIFLFKTMIVDNNKYKIALKNKTEVIVYGESSPRGRIYDRNYNLLVDNKIVPVIYYKKQDNVTIREEIDLAYKILECIDIDSGKLSLTNFKEFWISDNPLEARNKITKEEWLKLENRILNSTDIYYLQISRITEDDLSIYDELDKKAAYIYYLMNKGYSYEEKVIKKSDISDMEYAYIAENVDNLKGFNVKYSWERVYPYGDTFRTILGNISSITKEDKNYYVSRGYSLDELVGLSYLEKQYEDVLRGKKAKYRVGDNKIYCNDNGIF